MLAAVLIIIVVTLGSFLTFFCSIHETAIQHNHKTYFRYDFAVYGLLSSEIGACFFPESDKKMQLIGSFGVFLAAFIMR